MRILRENIHWVIISFVLWCESSLIGTVAAFLSAVFVMYKEAGRSCFIAETTDSIAEAKITKLGQASRSQIESIYEESRAIAEAMWESGR